MVGEGLAQGTQDIRKPSLSKGNNIKTPNGKQATQHLFDRKDPHNILKVDRQTLTLGGLPCRVNTHGAQLTWADIG